MALFKFTANTLEGRPIDVYNNGDMERDFTYIDDIVEAIHRLATRPAPTSGESDRGASPVAPYRVVNIGNGEPLAMAYAGHQFGGFVPQLGDGLAG